MFLITAEAEISVEKSVKKKKGRKSAAAAVEATEAPIETAAPGLYQFSLFLSYKITIPYL